MPNGYQVVCRAGITVLTFDLLHSSGVAAHCFTTRRGGVSSGPCSSLNMALHVGDREQDVLENRRRACALLGASLDDLVAGQQVHGAGVAVVGEAQRGAGARQYSSALPDTDALVTDRPGLVLASFYADCVPVYLLDPRRRAAGLAHAGWQGTRQKIAARAVQAMQSALGCRPADILAVIGPSIGPCCYTVGEDVHRHFTAAFPGQMQSLARPAETGKWHLDLWQANRQVLEEAGLKADNIYTARLCTSCREDLFFSYRRQRGQCGRMAALLRLL
ncbi:MAG: peptidoglycan editing factor PgeF [Desulfurispora sp.]|uniref:peptidoglycan editing factor PgeF n=1 Tax=Desulfurispora sp. TaxID=3014275 RepID=UPI00404B407C